MPKLYSDFKKYQFAQWERIVWRFNMIVFPIMCILEVYYY